MSDSSDDDSTGVTRSRKRTTSTVKAVKSPLTDNGGDSPTSPDSHRAKRRRSRKGLEKQYACEEQGCGKKFTRLEHLYRHQLNHRPKVIFHCGYDGCDKTFVREDLKLRHMERHAQWKQRGSGSKAGRRKSRAKDDSMSGNGTATASTTTTAAETTTTMSTVTSTQMVPAPDHGFGSIGSSISPAAIDSSKLGPSPMLLSDHSALQNSQLFMTDPLLGHKPDTHGSPQDMNATSPFTFARGLFTNGQSSVMDSLNGVSSYNIGRPVSDLRTTSLIPIPVTTTPGTTSTLDHAASSSRNGSTSATNNNEHHTNGAMNPPHTIINDLTNTTHTAHDINADTNNPADLIDWFFSDAMISNAKDPILSPSMYSFDSPMSLHSLLSPPSTQEESTISEQKRAEIISIFPQMEGPETGLIACQRYIAKFWAYIHPQYPILHKPTFQADTCPAGLLWTILLLGAAIEKQHEFASKLAEPLRWYLFGSPDFHPPTKLWVIQALVMLELFEKTMSNRREHERAHIHHATTLQLLRRGSVLRGMEAPREVDPWKRWIETEAAKRVALMAFVLDVFDATMFGHAMVMSVHEIRLSLPCSESIWAEFPVEKGIPKIQSMPFLVALKKLLNKSHVDTGPFGRRVLLGGLLCISHQMQEQDLRVSSLGWGQFKDTWREVVAPAYNFWKYDYDSSIQDDVPTTGSEPSNYSYAMELQGCTSSFYHLAHMSMLITFLDSQVYAGCPSVLNQPVRQLDHENAVRKVNEWAVSPYGRQAYWHAIQFLKEMYLTMPQSDSTSLYVAKCSCPPCDDKKNELEDDGGASHEVTKAVAAKNVPLQKMIRVQYDAFNDPVGKRPNAVYLCALMVWTFGYCREGPETTILAETVSSIEQEFRAAARENGSSSNGHKLLIEPEEAINTIESETGHIQAAEDGYEFLHRMSQYTPAELDAAKNRNQTVGLVRMVVQSLKYHNTELVQEGRRLLVHCIDRSLGRNKIRCEYMFSPRAKGGE